MSLNFSSASEAFSFFWLGIPQWGEDYADTKAIMNESFSITNPLDFSIQHSIRKWSETYAKREWDWYMTGERSIEKIVKYAPMWQKMADKHGEVWSNYGYWWKLNGQLDFAIKLLKDDPQTRRAIIVHYDPIVASRGAYVHDTPCNLVLNFHTSNLELDGYLHLTVFARSIDLWYGFCNDQYIFARLLQKVAGELCMSVGTIHYFITNFHIYKNKLV